MSILHSFRVPHNNNHTVELPDLAVFGWLFWQDFEIYRLFFVYKNEGNKTTLYVVHSRSVKAKKNCTNCEKFQSQTWNSVNPIFDISWLNWDTMALHFSSACLLCGGLNQRTAMRTRAVASEDAIAVKTEEDKVKLGGSELKVTRLGIGAWSWGDTSYWNNFEWDGMSILLLTLSRIYFKFVYS